jgi:branched-chain amino acid transport system substrate-binding protein
MKKVLAASFAIGMALTGAAAAEDVFRIGVLNDQSSMYSDLTGSGSVTAARLAVEDFGPTVLGRKIEIVTADHQNKPDIGAAIARRWIESENVQAIVDVPASSVALAVQEITRASGTPFLISGAATSDLTGKACSPVAVHWTYDTYALSAGAARGLVRSGAKRVFFLTQDNAFGASLQAEVSRFLTQAGGEVVGSVKHPLNTTDFSSYLVQAEAAKPDAVVLATAGSDFTTAVKQAGEFGLASHGIKIVGTSVTINDVHSLGLKTAQGVQFVTPFYWDMTPETRAWSKRFSEREKKEPNHIHAGVYGAVMQYLRAVKETGSSEGSKVVAHMREMPINDFMTKDGKLRADGRVLREFYFMEVKKPEESKGPWDYFKLVATLSPDETARPLGEGDCKLVSQ